MSAGKLSAAVSKQAIKQVTHQIEETSSNWRQVVDRRVEEKTRRFTKGVQNVYESRPDAFGPIAG